MTKALLLAGAAFAVQLVAPLAAAAQERRAAPADMAATSPEIIVTARRREESAQHVPVAVTAFSGEALRVAGVKNLSEMTLITPGLRYSSDGEGNVTSVSLRGLSKLPVGQSLPAVVTYFAEVALPSLGVNPPTYDLANVQVLKGPQGTLFGRNALGGAILVTPRAPEFSFGGYLQGTYGNLDYRSVEGALNLPIVNDVLAVRVAGKISRRDGTTRDLRGGPALSDIHNDALRVSALFRPTSALTNTTIFEYFDANEEPSATVPRMVSSGIAFLPEPYAQGIRDAIARQQQVGPFKTFVGPPDLRSNRHGTTLVNTTQLDLTDDIYIKNIFGYQKSRVDILSEPSGIPSADLNGPFGPLTILIGALQSHRRLISNELQLQGKSFDDKLTWIVGGIYSEDKPLLPSGTYSIAFQFGPPGPINYGTALIGDKSKAVFAQASLDVSKWTVSGLKLTGGFRYTWDSVTSCGLGSTSGYKSPSECRRQANLNLVDDGAGIVRVKDSEPTYTLGLDWQVSDQALVYLQHRHGYRGANVNAPRFETQFTTGGSGCNVFGTPTPCPDLRPFQTTKPERINDVEAGLKTQWRMGKGRGRFNVAIYQNELKGQVQFLNVTALGVPSSAPDNPSSGSLGINASDLRSRGVEFEGVITPDNQLVFSINGAYNKTKVLKINVPPLAGVGLSENEINRPTPKFSGTAAIDWTAADEVFGGTLKLHGDYYHSSSYAPQSGVALPGFDVVSLRADLISVGGSRVDLGLWMRNALDNEYISANGILVPGFTHQTVSYGEPRNYGVDLRFHW
jgi:iron complex outermembrane recepter protein